MVFVFDIFKIFIFLKINIMEFLLIGFLDKEKLDMVRLFLENYSENYYMEVNDSLGNIFYSDSVRRNILFKGIYKIIRVFCKEYLIIVNKNCLYFLDIKVFNSYRIISNSNEIIVIFINWRFLYE